MNFFKPAEIQNIPPSHGIDSNDLSSIRKVLDKMPFGCIIYDAQFRIIYINGWTEKIFGYSFQEVEGKEIFGYFSPEDLREYHSKILKYLKGGKSASNEIEENKSKDGETIICEMESSPFIGINGSFKGVIRIFQDITEKVQNERLSEGQKQILEMIASGVDLSEILNELILFMEKESGRTRGSVLILDDQGKELNTGSAPHLPDEYNQLVNGLVPSPYNGSCGTAVYSKKIIIVEDISESIHWVNYKDIAEHFGLKACTSIPIFGSNNKILGTFAFYYDTITKPSPHEFRLIEASSALAGIAIEKDKTQRALIESEEKFRTVFEYSTVGIMILDLDGKFLKANNAFCDSTGYSTEELLKMTVFDVVHPDYVRETEINRRTMLYGKSNTCISEKKFLQKNGNINWGILNTTLLRNNLNQPLYFISVLHDITDRKIVEENQKLLTNDLMKQNEGLYQFSYITSHNLRSPIANILGIVELINTNPTDPDNEILIEKLKTAATSLDNLISDLNTIVSLKKGEGEIRKKIYFDELVNTIKQNLSSQIEKSNVKIITDFSAEPVIFSTLSYVTSIVSNLIENAIKYRSPKRNLIIKIKSFTHENFVCLTICDNGLGIDLEKQGEKIFGLYKRFHAHVEGKGLGLHLVKTQIESLGGHIEVSSKPNVGTCFRAYFKKN